MRQYISVWMLCARSTIYKVFGLFFVMAAVEAGVFYYAMSGEAALLPKMLDRSHIDSVFLVFSYLITLLLYQTGSANSGKQCYTLDRLSISPRGVVVMQSIYNAAVFFLLWAVQIFIATALCFWYVEMADPSLVNGQTVFMAFYRSDFLHNLLPLDDWIRYVRNGIFILAFGFLVARAIFSNCHGNPKFPLWVPLWCIMLMSSLSLDNRWMDVVVIFGSLVAIAAVIILMAQWKEDTDEA